MLTNVWYGDQQIELRVPDNWELTVHNPVSVKPLSEQAILEHLEAPTGHATLRQLCHGKSAPLIIVDDLNRPTPVSKVMPYLMQIFADEGIDLSSVTILMATGTHGPPPADAFQKKVGLEAASKCKTLVHNCFRDVKRIGKTSSGTPVYINKAVLDSDLVIGVGGIYPNHTAGFGGGTKIILGVLGMRSIFHLHYNHSSSGWGKEGSTGAFRKDLDEIARMAKLKTCLSLQIDAKGDLIRLDCGEPTEYYQEAVKFCQNTFSAPKPHNADVVISNTYPNDLSLTFASMKGFVPLHCCKKDSSRIAIASCREGVGLHNIYPYVTPPRLFKLRHVARCFIALDFRAFIQKICNRLMPAASRSQRHASEIQEDDGLGISRHPIWVYRPDEQSADLANTLSNLKIISDWQEIVDAIEVEQGSGKKLKVAVYPCAFLQNII